MTKNELQTKLHKANISPQAYSLDGGYPDAAFCLSRNDTYWECYYSERGRKQDLKILRDEHDACDYFYSTIFKILIMRSRRGL